MKDFIAEWREINAQRNRLEGYAEGAAPNLIHQLTHGQFINGKLQQPAMSLRQLARRMKRSPTYLSQVANGHQMISVDAFCDLLKVMEEHAG